MFYFGFLPIAFDANGNFKTHRLSKFWLKKCAHMVQNGQYVLSGQTPQGKSYQAFFDTKGKFLFVRIESWTKVVSNQDPWFEVYLSHIIETIAAGGQKHLVEKNYQVNERTTKIPAYPEDFDWSSLSPIHPEKEVSDALKKQGFCYEPNEIIVKTLKEVYTSQLGEKKFFREIRIDGDCELISKDEDEDKDIYSIQKEHFLFWENLHAR